MYSGRVAVACRLVAGQGMGARKPQASRAVGSPRLVTRGLFLQRGAHVKSQNGDNAVLSTHAWQRSSGNDNAGHEDATAPVRAAMAAFVAQQQRATQLRSGCFGGLKLRNPSWDMLVALFAANQAGRQLSMSDLCAACDAPESTALRLIHQLRDKGYAELAPDRSDRRRTCVSLTHVGEAEFGIYIGRLMQVEGPYS